MSTRKAINCIAFQHFAILTEDAAGFCIIYYQEVPVFFAFTGYN